MVADNGPLYAYVDIPLQKSRVRVRVKAIIRTRWIEKESQATNKQRTRWILIGASVLLR
jgi:hypothetical protein